MVFARDRHNAFAFNTLGSTPLIAFAYPTAITDAANLDTRLAPKISAVGRTKVKKQGDGCFVSVPDQ